MENPMDKIVTIGIVKPSEWQALKDIRIESLTKNPEAFGSTLEKALAKSPEEWQADLSLERKFMVVAKVDDTNSGAVSMAGAFRKDDSGVWQVIGVYTRHEFRGQGASEKVMKEVLEEVRRRGGKKARLNVTERPEQESARKLYAKLGFKMAGKEKEAGEFTLVMEKEL